MTSCRQTQVSQGFSLIVDDTGHRKSGNFTSCVARQYIGEVGKIDSGIVTVTTHLYDGVKSLPIEAKEGRDIVTGGKGSDRIVGGSGADRLTGGEGGDRFVYTSIRDAGNTIRDFTVNEDWLDFRQLSIGIQYQGSNPIADCSLDSNYKLPLS